MEKMKNIRGAKLLRVSPVGFVCLFSVFAGLFTIASCSTGVGDPCLPEQIPVTSQQIEGQGSVEVKGYDRSEVYIESSSVQCETRVCGVFQLNGDPSPDCDSKTSTCPTREEIDSKVYCTCRCKAPDKRFATCECPDGYECKEVLTKGEDGTKGSYCVKSGTLKIE